MTTSAYRLPVTGGTCNLFTANNLTAQCDEANSRLYDNMKTQARTGDIMFRQTCD